MMLYLVTLIGSCFIGYLVAQNRENKKEIKMLNQNVDRLHLEIHQLEKRNQDPEHKFRGHFPS